MIGDLSELNPGVVERARKITLLVLDVDGVLTDGKVYYGNYGDELQAFSLQDGMGMVLWHQAGLQSVIVSGRRSGMVKRRAKEMRVAKVFQSAGDKEKIYLEILQNMGKSDEEVCFVGDDLVDVPLLRRAGLAVAVGNAVAEVKESAHYVTEHAGGNGAVREVIDLLLKANGKWEKVTHDFLK